MTTTDDEVVIGEGVVLDASAATVGLRTGGALIDGLILVAGYFLTLWGLGSLGSFNVDGALLAAVFLSHFILVFVGVPIAIETLTRGRSVGKLAAGIRIVRDDGGPVSFRHAFTRALVGIIEIYALFGSIAFLTSLVSKRSKRVGDMFAGTYALRVRGSRGTAAFLYVPGGLTEWSQHADIRRLPDGLALRARQFITRASSLSPRARAHFGTTYAEQLAPYVAPPPPDGTHPEAFIMAVLATRRDREHAIESAHMAEDAAQAHSVQRLPFGVPEVGD